MRPLPFAFLLAVAVLGLLPGQAQADARHFQTSQLHFEELATKAAVLSQSVENLGERNILNFYVASAVLYANRAHALAQMADILEALSAERDKAMVLKKIQQTQHYVTMNLPNDLRELESLSEMATTPQVKNLGVRLINDLRVFQRNAEIIH